MEWWSILGYVIGIPAGIYLSLRLRSMWAERREKQRKAIDQLKENFFSTEQTIKRWDSLHGSYVYESGSSLSLIQWLEKETENKDIPQKLHKRMKEIIECLDCYEKWLDESRYIIRAEIEEECEKGKSLVDLWPDLNPYRANWSGIWESMLPLVLENLKGELESFALPLIYEKRLNTEQVGKLFHNKWPDIESHIYEVGSEEKVITTEDFIKHKDFQKLVENLKELENWPSIEEARKYREKSLFKINEVLEKV